MGDFWVLFIRLGVFLRAKVRTVRGIGGDISEEWLILVVFDEFDALVEPDVCAVSFELFEFSVNDVSIVKIIIGSSRLDAIYQTFLWRSRFH